MNQKPPVSKPETGGNFKEVLKMLKKKRHADKSDLLTLIFWTHCRTYTGNKMLMISYEMITEGLY